MHITWLIEMTRHKMRRIVKLNDWQKLRVSLLGTWKTKRLESLSRLQCWLGNIANTTDRHLIIIHNYITALYRGGLKFNQLAAWHALIINEMVRRNLCKIK